MAGKDAADILSGIRLIIFDFDGVVVDSEPLHHKKFAEVLAEEGITLTWDEYKAKYLAYNDHDCFWHVLKDRGRDVDETALARLVSRKADSFDRDMKTGVLPVPGTADFIRRAAPRYLMAIASGALRHEIEEILEWQGLREFFPVIVGAEDAPRGKPNPDPFLKALELTNGRLASGAAPPALLKPEAQVPTTSSGHPLHRGEGRGEVDRLKPVSPAECLVIEDSPLGIEGAKAAGMRTLGLTTSYKRERLSQAEHVLAGLHRLPMPAVERLNAMPPQVSNDGV